MATRTPPGTAERATQASSAPSPPIVDLEPGPEPSLGELISRTTSDLSELVRDEIELAKVEITEEVKQAGKAGAFMGGAGLMGYLALTLLCFAAAWGLSEVLPAGVAFLIVGAVVAIAAAVMFLMGRSQAEQVDPVPRQTVETIQEDVQWARQLRS